MFHVEHCGFVFERRWLMAALKVGEVAPDFQLTAVTGMSKHEFRLSDYRGKKNVVLAFHPLNWTPV
jgi:peroxiredoxin